MRSRDRNWAPASVLFAGYVTTLVALPSDVGIATPWAVLSASRILLVVGIAVGLVEATRAGKRAALVPSRALMLAWFAFLIAAGASSAFGAFGSAWARLGSLALEGAGASWLSWHVARGWPVRAQSILVSVSAVVVLVTMSLAAFGYRYGALFGDPLTGEVRFGLLRQQAAFDAPLFFAVWLVAASVLAAGLALSTGERRRWLFVGAWICLSIGIIFTASRVGLISVPALLAILLVARGRPMPGLAAGLIAVVIAAAFLAGPGGLADTESLVPQDGSASPSVLAERQSGAPSGSAPASSGSGEGPSVTPSPGPDLDAERLRGSTNARVDAIKATVAAVSERPLLGWGLLSAKRVAEAKLGHPNFVDNTYLVLLIEQGVVGLATFLVLVAATVMSAWPVRSALVASQLVAILAILGFGMFAATLATSQGWALFWVVCGLAVGTAASASDPGRRLAASATE